MDRKKGLIIAIVIAIMLMVGSFAFTRDSEQENTTGKDNQQQVTPGNDNSGSSEQEDETNNDSQEDEDNSLTVNGDNNSSNTQTGNGNQNGEGNANDEQITDDGYDAAKKAVEAAKESLELNDYKTAEELVGKVTDATKKAELEAELTEIQNSINAIAIARQKVEELETKLKDSQNRNDIEQTIKFRDEDVANALSNLKDSSLKKELQNRVDKVSKILDDTTAPKIEGIGNNEFTNQDVNLKISDTNTDINEITKTLTLNGNEIAYLDEITEEGIYVLTVMDKAFNKAQITFTVDKTAPEFEGLEQSGHYESAIVKVNDNLSPVTITVENRNNPGETYEIENGTELTEEATYHITITDKAGNPKDLWIAIDKQAPDIIGVDDSELTNEEPEITIKDKFLTSVVIDDKEYTRNDFEVGSNNENFKFTKTIRGEGKHTIVAKDKYGHITSKTFTIDQTPANRVHSTVDFDKNPVYSEKIGETTYYYIKNGASFVFRMRFTEELAENPILNIGNKKVTLEFVEKYLINEGKYIYEATVVINKEDNLADGKLSLILSNVVDKAGNKTEDPVVLDQSRTSNSRSVILDNTKPEVDTLRVKGIKEGNGTSNFKYIKIGDTFQVILTTKEELATLPILVIDGKEVTEIKSQKYDTYYQYIASYKIPQDTTLLDGKAIEFTLKNYADKAGNVGKDLTNADIKIGNGQTEVIFDKTAPTIEVKNDSIGSNGVYSKINFKLKDNYGLKAAIVNGKEYPRTTKINDLNFQNVDNYVEGSNTVILVDLAGNESEPFTFTLDTLAPEVDTLRVKGLKEGNGTTNFKYIKIGDTFQVILTTKEELATLPTLIIDGKEITEIKSQKYDTYYQYIASYQIPQNTTLLDGKAIEFTLKNYADKAGNVGKDLTNADIKIGNGQTEVIFDKTAPTIEVKNDSIGSNGVYSKINFKLKDNYGLKAAIVNGKEYPRTTKINDLNFQNVDNYVEGSNTVILVDLAGNESEPFTFTLDTLAPEVRVLGIAQNRNNPNTNVTNGDSIRIWVYFKEELAVLPKVKLGEKEYPMYHATDSDPYAYILDVVLDDTMKLEQGEIKFKIFGYSDEAGNTKPLTNENITYIGKNDKLIYDTVKPEPTSIGILNLSNFGTGNDKYAKIGDNIQVMIYFKELLAVEPTVNIGGKEYTAKYLQNAYDGVKGYAYFASDIILENVGLGQLEYTISNYQDIAGNTGETKDQNDATDNVYKEVIVINDSTVLIDSNADIVNAIKNQQNGQTWLFTKEGKYDVKNSSTIGNYPVPSDVYSNSITFPIYADNITITKAKNVGDVILTSSYVATTGNWYDQNFITVFGSNVTIDGIDLQGNYSEFYEGINKVLELYGEGKDLTLKNINIIPLTNEDGKFGGSIYINVENAGNTIIENVNMDAWINAKAVTTGTVKVVNVTIDFTNSIYAGYYSSEYGYAWNPAITGTNVNVESLTIKVDNKTDLKEQIFNNNFHDGTTVLLSNGEYNMDTLLINNVANIIGENKDNTILNFTSYTWSQAGMIITKSGKLQNVTINYNGPITTVNGYKIDSLKITSGTKDANQKLVLIDNYTIDNVNINGGASTLNVHGVKDAVINNVKVEGAAELGISIASSNATITNTNVLSGTWGSIGIMYPENPTEANLSDYPMASTVTIGNNVKVNKWIYAEHSEVNKFVILNPNEWVEIPGSGSGAYNPVGA